jgi:hypothetical protein
MSESNNCGICFETLQKTNICVTSCGHTFCLQCILKNNNYNNNCPYCRKQIIENIDKNNEIIDIVEEEEMDPFINNIQYKYGHYIDDCYYYPVVIEDINVLAGVINEVTAGLFCYDNCMGWILGIIGIKCETEDNSFNYRDDVSLENNFYEIDFNKTIINEAIFIYKRTILLKSHLLNKISK